jgi:opacity protein-like surface antigen
MRVLLLAGVAAAALSAFGSTASAQTWVNGAYVGADIGYSWSDGVKGTSSANATDGQPYAWTFNREDTPAGYLRLGTRFSPNWRVELEGGYRKGDIETVRGDGARAQPVGLCAPGVRRTTAAPACGDLDGEMRVGSVMANLLFDFMPESRLRPFIGAGVGYVEVHNKVYGQLSGVPAGGAPFQNANFDDTDSNWGAQGIIGVSYDLSDHWTMDLTGRYLTSGDMTFGANTQNAAGARFVRFRPPRPPPYIVPRGARRSSPVRYGRAQPPGKGSAEPFRALRPRGRGYTPQGAGWCFRTCRFYTMINVQGRFRCLPTREYTVFH